jgi:hypothetical protein
MNLVFAHVHVEGQSCLVDGQAHRVNKTKMAKTAVSSTYWKLGSFQCNLLLAEKEPEKCVSTPALFHFRIYRSGLSLGAGDRRNSPRIPPLIAGYFFLI